MSVLRKGRAPLGPKVGVTWGPFLLTFLLPPPVAGVGFTFVRQAAQTPRPSFLPQSRVLGLCRPTRDGDGAFAWCENPGRKQ